MNLLEIVKSNVGFVGGVMKSKKYGLAFVWVMACVIQGSKKGEWAPWIAGAIGVAAYCIAQALVEASAARKAKE